MIHIIWSGKGCLVGVVVFGFSLIANLLSNSITGSGQYWDDHKWPLAIALFASAAVCQVFGRIFREPETQVLIDPETSKELVRRTTHSFFFIPIKCWAPILAAGGAVALGAEFLK